jgi:glycine/D-amino acid oxidase-like deaminating enzyme
MKDYRTYSFWLETAGDDLQPRPPLEGSVDVDVAILGAGYSGLWTAYYLLQAEPSLRVALVEKEVAGFGASGRNGGWCSSSFPLSPSELTRRFGREAAVDLQRAMWDSVNEIGRVCEAEGIDAQFAKGGCLRVARGAHQLSSLRGLHAAYAEMGVGGRYHLLGAEETAERVRIPGVVAALFTPECASIHPGRLVRGLARAVERRGATIYEQSEVIEVVRGIRPAFHTPRGTVRSRTVVLAGEAYMSGLRAMRRRLAPIYSLIVLTEPLSQEQWERIGWRQRECISSMRYTVDYLNRTADGRILFGSRGAPYHFGSRIDDRYDRHASTHEVIGGLVREWFPFLEGVGLSHTWGGPVGMPRDWMPSVGYEAETGTAWACGYTGQGVATSNLAGRILADLMRGVGSPITALLLSGHQSPRWEPEPLRWLAIRYMQGAYGRVDRKAERTGRAPRGTTLAERLGRH